ncbi:MAG: hypothetical protein GY820_44230 [Gammaproteobacteria bacterium]|nr:hypothetical protein [Gammaproteobacteria bacterium]
MAILAIKIKFFTKICIWGHQMKALNELFSLKIQRINFNVIYYIKIAKNGFQKSKILPHFDPILKL